MAVKVLELHHHGIRVGPSEAEVRKAHDFYSNVLGLSRDPGRPVIPTIDGHWMDVGGTAQIHLMGVNGMSKFAKGPEKDPSRPHVEWAPDSHFRVPECADYLVLGFRAPDSATQSNFAYNHVH